MSFKSISDIPMNGDRETIHTAGLTRKKKRERKLVVSRGIPTGSLPLHRFYL